MDVPGEQGANAVTKLIQYFEDLNARIGEEDGKLDESR